MGGESLLSTVQSEIGSLPYNLYKALMFVRVSHFMDRPTVGKNVK